MIFFFGKKGTIEQLWQRQLWRRQLWRLWLLSKSDFFDIIYSIHAIDKLSPVLWMIYNFYAFYAFWIPYSFFLLLFIHILLFNSYLFNS
jgi:hypothetical protein